LSEKLLHQVDPREQAGRDSIARFKAQFRAAAFYCLAILKDAEIDAVFCDLHEDYVVRKKGKGWVRYDFYQVKTKEKKGFQWGLDDVFGIKKRKPTTAEAIRDSFVGKLLMHTFSFGDSCLTVNLQSNKDFSEAVYLVQEAMEKKDVTQIDVRHIFSVFRDVYPAAKNLNDDEIKECFAKLRLVGASSVVDIEGADYYAITRQAIFDNSEVDLNPIEFKEIVLKLLSLVEEKSAGKIKNFSEDNINGCAGIFLDDVLEVMAISPAGYKYIRDGGDPKALKSASIIQRLLKAAGASSELIDFCCKCKSDYDIWLSGARHYIDNYEYLQFSTDVNMTVIVWLRQDGSIQSLMRLAKEYRKNLAYDFGKMIDDDKCLGAFLAEIVRLKT
jgi:Cap4 dsDNA endonuclease